MFYNKYTDYSPEQIKTEKYEELGKQLLNIAKDPKIKEIIESVLYEGGYGEFSANARLTRRNNVEIERKKRIGYAYLLATNPETFNVLNDNNINLFHGTNSNALSNILKYGMKSVDEQSKNGIVCTTGEKWSRIEGKRSFISYTDDIDTALDYSGINLTENELNQGSFGMIIGMSSSDLNQLKTCHINSEVPEIGINDNIPLELIKTIAVPEDKVEFVRKLVGDREIIVTPINIEQRFYYMDLEGEINVYLEEAQKLAERTNNIKPKVFNSNEIAQMSKTRKMSRIHSIYEKIKNVLKIKGKENDIDARD